MKKRIWIIAYIALYILVSLGVIFALHLADTVPPGDDTMYHIYRGELLVDAIKNGNYYPLYDSRLYNGVQIFRYFAPASAYLIAACQIVGEYILSAEPYVGYRLYVGLIYFLGACGFLYSGVKLKRIGLGGFLGLIWFFSPGYMINFFGAGNMAMGFCLAVLPYLFVSVFLLTEERDIRQLKWVVIFSALTTLGHLDFFGMMALGLLFYLLIYKFINFREVKILPSVLAVVLGPAVVGIWTVPAAIGGITSSSSTNILSPAYFQNLLTTLNPFERVLAGGRVQYFSLVLFLLSVLGILFSMRRERAAFVSGFLLVVFTSEFMYQVFLVIPGGRYMWMIRFLSIATAIVFFGFLYWRTLRRWIVVVICVLLVADVIPEVPLMIYDSGYTNSGREMEAFAGDSLLDEARLVTKQRVAVLDKGALAADAPYFLGNDGGVAQTFGAGIEAAYTRRNITYLNEALDQGEYGYLFDRCLNLGNDTVLIKKDLLKNGQSDMEPLGKEAALLGYKKIKENDGFVLYHLDTEVPFGVMTDYEALGIGTWAGGMEVYFPRMTEGDSLYLDDYTFDDLKDYHTILLNNFDYHNKDAAESLVKKLADAGVRVVISSDGIPINKKLQFREFLGVSASDVEFENGYPLLYFREQEYDLDLFKEKDTDWKTTFVNGLDTVEGFFFDEGIEAPFMGRVYNENVYIVGINLFYFYATTHDVYAGEMIEHAMDMTMGGLPEREIVPLGLEYENNTIRIHSDYEDVNTTLAYQDNFEIHGKAYKMDNLMYVSSGYTVVGIPYPHRRAGALVSLFGVAMWAIFYVIFEDHGYKRGN